jgi:uncharacterized protein (DUF58 family)
MQRFLDPAVLASIGSLELLARTVVDGFIAGLHRSADFGFSQEFAEYRAYTTGEDPRHVDWNLFARTDRMYLRRYRGETNSQATILLDASNSMRFASTIKGAPNVSKMDYARFAAAAILYMALQHQRDAAGLVVFDDEVREAVRPSTKHGQLHRLLAALERAEPKARTNFEQPLQQAQELLRRRGMVMVFSDFFEDPERLVRAIEPLRHHGNEVTLFHVLDPREIHPVLRGPSVLQDLETGQTLEVIPEYARHEYQRKMQAHMASVEQKTRASGMDYQLLVTDQPLDGALRAYLALRNRRKSVR